MALPRIGIDGSWFIDAEGRKVILRGVNLGGDCKMPYPDGGTNHPTDFSDHRTVSFVGRPFPMDEADEHFSRLAAWGFNCLRLLTTWEAVEHAGPRDYDTDYLDYYAELCRRAGEYGLYVFVDFHQDVWSRMTGGDGAPAWIFEKVGLDFTKFHEAGAAHVMQYKYDYARGGRQEDNYPTMTWAQNYRLPANGIMWTLFFAGRDFAPDMIIDGQNVQDYLQAHYAGCLVEIAKRVKDLPNVIGFDTLNEPGTGFVGQRLSYQHVGKTEENPRIATPGPAWSALDGLAVARGVTRSVPQLEFSLEHMASVVTEDRQVNPGNVNCWLPGAEDPFEKAGAYRRTNEGVEPLREDFFQSVDGRKVDLEDDYMAPFFDKVAKEVRAVRDDWLIFAELDPFTGLLGGAFPVDTPDRTVNASHWYDIALLSTKEFMFPTAVNPFSGKTLNGREEIEAHYRRQLSNIQNAGRTLNSGTGAPTLIGECGTPYDLAGAAAYQAWAEGDRSEEPWKPHIMALEFLYNALDAMHLSSTQWNYTASNSNDLAVGDGWNQEDLSIFSRDQQDDPTDINSGGRALKGFVRPYLQACKGTPLETKFTLDTGEFVSRYQPEGSGEATVFVPVLQYPDGYSLSVDGGTADYDAIAQKVTVTPEGPGEVSITITPVEEG
ncbi:cellulase family glycosylhydrolase [Parvibaculaceae bacterium PLY_AMNH_Bact1]|nr:cellulase family glycosylhydrolase [Parvibaculaceae bacterium PLY_AMNH_Bact1]